MSNPPCTVAYVIDDLGFGGAQKQLATLVPLLPQSIRPIVVCTSNREHPFADTMRSRNIEVIALGRRGHADVRRACALAALVRSRRVDVVHGFLDAANVYAYIAARVTGRPVALSMRSDRLRLSGPRAKVLRHALRRADAVTVNSRRGRDALTGKIGVDACRVTYIPNWIVAPEAAHAARSTAPVVGFVGRFSHEKDVGLLIDAFALLRAKFPSAQLTLVGDGPFRAELEARVHEKGVAEATRFVAPHVDIESTLRGFDCLVLPSRYEGLSNAAVEALAVGVPVVASDVGDLADLIKEGKTGTMMRERTPQALADAIARAIADDGVLRRTAAIEGPRLVRERYGIDRALASLVPLYLSLRKRP